MPQRRSRHAIPDDDDAEAEDDSADEIEDLDDLDLDNDENQGRSKAKYMRIMRKVANRQTTEVVIDLNDLQSVRPSRVKRLTSSSQMTAHCCTIS